MFCIPTFVWLAMEKSKKIETLVATMHQKDLSLVENMHIESDVVIANQTDMDSIANESRNGCSIKMINTRTRGVGVNRNLALLMSEADIVLFADDDVIYNAGYSEHVLKAFEELPQADVIIFGMKFTKLGEVIGGICSPTKRIHIWNAMKYGTSAIAVRRDKLLRENIMFTQLFGGGCKYGSGEDSLFLLESLRRGLVVYTYDYVLGKSSQDTSTWFTGYNKKYFYDKGVWLACAFPHMKHFLKWYFVFRFKNQTELSVLEVIRLINKGICGFRTLEVYEEV